MGFTTSDFIQIGVLLIGILVSMAVFTNEMKNLKEKHNYDVNILDHRIGKNEDKLDRMEKAVVDLKWIKSAVSEIKCDLKELKKKNN